MLRTAYKWPVNAARLRVSSPVIENGGEIPAKYTCDGANINPPLEIKGIPQKAACLAIIMEDADAPITTWTHWLAWNIPVKHHIKEHHITDLQGTNDFGIISYKGPCPPSGTHRYCFRVFVLDALLDLPAGAGREGLEAAMTGHVLAAGQLIANYRRRQDRI